ncbi:GNAT family N-acetyltransferase [Nocardia arizonensis]|uniref:GNAT family N-acetyltransferase n=1 Tax=Nocardia arizonensis TaxID=1141647 RepID=UPI0006D1875D|nr:GNAT family protein [Nocardia arizonensis]
MWLSDGVISLRPITVADARIYSAADAGATVDWLDGADPTPGGVAAHFERCAADWATRGAARVFAVTARPAEGLVGTLGVHTGQPFLSVGQADLAYGLYPRWRRPMMAIRAVVLGCRYLAASELADEAVLRIDPADRAAVVVAHRAGFHFFRTSDDTETGRLDWYYQAV